jgi:hypothetical protein
MIIIIKTEHLGSFSAKKLTFILENHLKLRRFLHQKVSHP